MPDNRHDYDDLIGLGYDEHDIADRELTIERDGDMLIVVDEYGDEIDRHDEYEVDR